MNCEKFLKLTPIEKINFTGSLLHAAMNDDRLFMDCEKIIMKARAKGLFAGVVINPANDILNQNENLCRETIQGDPLF
jgi:hypothetical protein